MKKSILFLVLALCGCSNPGQGSFSKAEKAVIDGQGEVLRVLTIGDRSDSLFLRGECKDFSDKELKSETFRTLSRKLISTVTDPSEDGVGIAGPQVGIGRRVVAVQRFDKEGEPFEVYPNVRIESKSGEMVSGQEGCLSIPGMRGLVPRYSKITISYKDPSTLETVRDTIEGFTAVIFQHEADHLDGVLYIDRADSLWTDNR